MHQAKMQDDFSNRPRTKPRAAQPEKLRSRHGPVMR
jgi:hypothetical protein